MAKEVKSLKDIKQRQVSKEEYEQNQKSSKTKMIVLYLIPVILLIIIAIIYIPTHFNYLLIPFAILMFIVMFGWDGSTRTCPKCRKWNSVIWIKVEHKKNYETKTKTNFFGKEKQKQVAIKIRHQEGKCHNCGHTFNIEKNSII